MKKRLQIKTAARSDIFGEGSPRHQRRAQFLDCLATLAGCVIPVSSRVTEGLRPDVLRVAPNERLLFLGDAKATEKWSNLSTQGRLFRYYKWLAAWLSTEEHRVLCAICLGSEIEARMWLSLMMDLSKELRLVITDHGIKSFDLGYVTAWTTIKRLQYVS